MRQHILAALIAGPFAAALTGSATAQTLNAAGRTFVAGLGKDTGTCPRTAPCRNFAYAITQTPAGGEIVALDAAGYAPVTITKSISIAGPDGGGAHITVPSGGTGIQIAAGGGDSVLLRGIQILGGAVGINVASAGRVDVSDIVVSGATTAGLRNATSTTNVVVTKSGFLNNVTGIIATAGSLVAKGVQVSGGSYGVRAAATVQIVGCTIQNATTTGISADGGTLFVKGSVVTANGVGIANPGIVIVRIDTTTVTGNTSGADASVRSYGNNNIAGNGAGNGPFTTITPD